MTTLKVNSISNAAGTGRPDFSQGLTVAGSATIETSEYYSSSSEPSNPGNGAIWYDTTNSEAKVYTNDDWYTLTRQPTVYPTAWYGDRALAGGGYASSHTAVISYYDLTTSGNATSFGNLTSNRASPAALSDAARGVFASGQTNTANVNIIDYVTIATPGNATDFGDTVGVTDNAVGVCDGTTGVILRGQSGTSTVYMDYITVQTTGNASSFGTISISNGAKHNAGWNDATRGVLARGEGGSQVFYITIDTPGNATSFGNLTTNRERFAGVGDDTYAIFGGGGSNVIDYITVQTTGNATDFGDLLQSIERMAGASNGTTATFAGGEISGGRTNVIQSITVSTPGNAVDFGDLTHNVEWVSGLSGRAA